MTPPRGSASPAFLMRLIRTSSISLSSPLYRACAGQFGVEHYLNPFGLELGLKPGLNHLNGIPSGLRKIKHNCTIVLPGRAYTRKVLQSLDRLRAEFRTLQDDPEFVGRIVKTPPI